VLPVNLGVEMDKQAWQITLSVKVIGLLLGLVSAAAPPWKFFENTYRFVNIAREVYVGIGSLILLAGIASVVHNIWTMYKHGQKWESLYQPGPEHALVAVYAITIPLIYTVGEWVLLPAYIASLALILFIIGAYLGEELRQRNQQH
jgi:uncharacterized membrane protein HdeD (DUF308 family)